MKKIIGLLLAALMVFALCSCGGEKTEELSVVTTIFPQYDLARQILGADGSVQMLVTPGSESHFYEPTIKDIAAIKNADLFIYVGEETDGWAKEALEAIGGGVRTLKLTDIIEPIEQAELEGAEHSHHDHEEASFDEHVWTSPVNAIKILEEIKIKLKEIAPEKSAEFDKRAEDYKNEILDIHNDINSALKISDTKTLVFADRFPFRYFANEYSLDCFAAFSGCSSETEPTLETVKFLVDKIKAEKLPAVIITEQTTGSVAQSIGAAAGVKTLTLHSCHNVTKEQLKNGVTYAELMRGNAEVIKEALGCH